MASIETIEQITIDMLSTASVSVLKQTFAEINDQAVQIGSNWRRAYINSESGRAQIAEELPEPYLSAVMAVWGDAPTVTDKE